MKELPHDLLAEKSCLGSLIIDGGSFDELADLKLKAKDFFHPQYGIIFEAISDLSLANRPIDYITVCSKLTEKGLLEKVGGQSFILELIEDQASAANIYHYGRTVKDKSAIREIVRTAMRVAELGLDYNGEAADFFQEVEASFFRLTNEAKSGGMVKLNSCLKQNLKDLEDASRGNGEIQGLPTGFHRLDEFLLGMQPGQLIVLAARPAMGKTALALNIAQQACKFSNLPIAIFSLEMMATDLTLRMLSSTSHVDMKKIRTKNFLDTDLRSIGSAVQELSNLPVFINDAGDSTILDIQSQCRKIKAEHGLGLVVIDYLQLMSAHNKTINREQQISEISRGLKIMAKELGCPVLALSQLNRSVESRPNKRPNTSDLRESGAIEQDADIVMFIYRDEVYNQDTKEPGIAEIIVGKNRSGQTGTVKVSFVGAYTSFENPTFRHEPSANL